MAEGEVHYFATTHWSVVLSAGKDGSAEASTALEQLCTTCWHPIYHAVRRHGHGIEAAQDLTQEFFARLLTKDYLKLADPVRGRFRTFLLSALKNFLINQWNKDHALKRGGGGVLAPLGPEVAEKVYQTLASDDLGMTLTSQKRYREAEPLLVQGYAAIEKRHQEGPLPSDDALLRGAATYLVVVYKALGELEKAAEWRPKRSGSRAGSARPSPSEGPALEAR